MKLLLYCTKAKPYLQVHPFDLTNSTFRLSDDSFKKLNGKIVAECDFEVEEIFEDNLEDARDGYVEHYYTLKSYDDFDEGENVLLKESCLQKHELSNYLGFENGYAIHIKNLNIFDKPKELSEYYKGFTRDEIFSKIERINTAPQNMMYAYKNTSYSNTIIDKYVLISIKPEWLCKILNGEKTIEVRKKVLKEMK